MRDDRSVLDLLRADYTFLNERLARHYGVPERVRQPFPARAGDRSARRGLLGQASVLTVTSYADRTSVVLRGKWVLETLLGAPPPPPPPNVPPLKENDARRTPTSLRERMEQHRKQSRLRELPRADGSAWASRWRISTRRDGGARPTAARRSTRQCALRRR